MSYSSLTRSTIGQGFWGEHLAAVGLRARQKRLPIVPQNSDPRVASAHGDPEQYYILRTYFDHVSGKLVLVVFIEYALRHQRDRRGG